jgi:predicted nucleic acid-binding protein
MWSRIHRGEFTVEIGQELLDDLHAMGIETRPIRPVIVRALRLAHALAHPIYDCTYLALAEWLSIPLVTADQRFITALQRVQLPSSTDVRPLASFA